MPVQNNYDVVAHPVFFMIGCQRSGSNWLRTMLGQREDLIAPHPPHIMRDFLPIICKFGDLDDIDNLKILVDHVCSLVERNQVPWQDTHNRDMHFDRVAILKGSIYAMDSLRHVQRMEQMGTSRKRINIDTGFVEDDLNASTTEDIVGGEYYLLAIFDEIMNCYAKANGKKIWMCKSMGMSQYHDMLLRFYGKERLRYIYLFRDPRDVTLSFVKTPVGDCHPYVIAKKWARLQRYALRILSETEDLVHQVRYEDILLDKATQVSAINEFIGSRAESTTLRRGSVVVLRDDNEVVESAKTGREAQMANQLSYQFKNLQRGDSFTKGQMAKWKENMDGDDVHMVESCAREEMTRLGYFPVIVGIKAEPIHFTADLVEELEKDNTKLIEKMNNDLLDDNPEDFHRRKRQKSILNWLSQLRRVSFGQKTQRFVRDDAYDTDTDDMIDPSRDIENADTFASWPKEAYKVGFLSDEEVSDRFSIENTKYLLVEGGRGGRSRSFSIAYSAATQRGYYPQDRDKKNQDTFVSGVRSKSSTLFAVFDGHGNDGTACAAAAKDIICKQFLEKKKKMSFENMFNNAYKQANDTLAGSETIDASKSGTTAVSLCITDNGGVHVANVGDSRCLVISSSHQGGDHTVSVLTQDHTPDNVAEANRIKQCGGLVLTSDQYDRNKDDSIYSSEPQRVWSSEGKFPGTAFTRSIGDMVANELGVTSEPEHTISKLHKNDKMFVIGSDGIFDFISDDDIARISSQYSDPALVCKALVGISYKRWSDSEERTDDITVIVGKISTVKTGCLLC